jgi:peptidoglycan/xylan/chitin deacetylase (PgdA/CDA1 family)
VLDDILDQLDLDRRATDETRPMTVSELQNLSSDGLFDIGAHTVTHPQLSALGQDEQEYQILQSKQSLESLIGLPVRSFAYPYGSQTDYNTATIDIVQRAGFLFACSNFPGLVRNRNYDQYQLPRMLVRESGISDFISRVNMSFVEA